MNVLAAVHFFAFLIYSYLAIHVFMRAPRSRVHRTFLLVAGVFAFWAIAWSFAHAAQTRGEYARLMFASRMLVSIIPAALLHFYLVFTEDGPSSWFRRLGHAVIYAPAVVFIVRGFHGAFFFQDAEPTRYGWLQSPALGSAWYWAFSVYYVGYSLVTQAVAWRWGGRAAEPRRRRQARIIVGCGLAALGLILVDGTVLPAVLGRAVPGLPSVLSVVWVAGIAWAITRHGFLDLAPVMVPGALVEAIPDALVLTDLRGRILAVNRAALRTLERPAGELVGRPWREFLAPERAGDGERLAAAVRSGPVVGFETAARSGSGEVIPLLGSVSRVRTPAGDEIGSVAILRDDRERRRAEERIHRLAHHDPLTDLPNRLLFRDRLQQAVHRAQRYKHVVGVLILDVDRLKEVNDLRGHEAGDALLRVVAERLLGCLREGDTAARLGGDEFAVALPERGGLEDVLATGRAILAALREPVDIGGEPVHGGASIGIALYPGDAREPGGLLACADAAMYRAKRAGRNDLRVFDAAVEHSPDSRLLERGIARALEENRFRLDYQPQVEVGTGRVVGVEALVRWDDPERGVIPPLEFLPAAEESGLSVPLGEWVLRTACTQVAAWQAQGLPAVRLAVNVSPRQLLREGFAESVLAILTKVGLAPERLELEVTEQGARLDARRAGEVFRRLREVGIRLAVDDLGTGQTSLAFLARFPGQTLKIGQAIVRELPGRVEQRAVVAGLIGLAGELGFERVVAEGVETEAQLAFLREAGCPVVQGFLTGRPAAAHAVAVRLGGAEAVVGAGRPGGKA
ncbi:MAG: EAL domain-containing protein [Deltaproteobacteria bacterium]|nr:EAL domain-containing protein [Deltaproteobacteria bacterium]